MSSSIGKHKKQAGAIGSYVGVGVAFAFYGNILAVHNGVDDYIFGATVSFVLFMVTWAVSYLFSLGVIVEFCSTEEDKTND